MDFHRVSAMTKNQATFGKQGSQSSQDTGDSAGGWKYLTVRQGGKVYTYIVIGKNMRILIGETADKKTDDKDKKTADGNNEAAAGAENTNGAGNNAAAGSMDRLAVNGQNGGKKEETAKPDFLMDTSMLTLTGYYQKKMRETIKNLGDTIGNDNALTVKKSADAEKS
ncbi:MAG: hypothetical protein K0Q77_812 [Anaerosporomusa subterranea]|jgi:hypothetical protein|nr:hypothetical protein [Anaerosporomusa subterranea]